jgi:amino-acid N-acetyltransferase
MIMVPLTQNNFTAALDLLKKNNLPTEDISEATSLFVVEEDNSVIGTIALEYAGSEGLLRSLAVAEDHRQKGLGGELVSFIEAYAMRQGIQQLYLLTTTAEKFFAKRGYLVVERTAVSPFIQNSSEFASVCPSTAVVMKKIIS